MDRFGNGEEFTMERTLKTEKHGLSFQDFDQQLFTGKSCPCPNIFPRWIIRNKSDLSRALQLKTPHSAQFSLLKVPHFCSLGLSSFYTEWHRCILLDKLLYLLFYCFSVTGWLAIFIIFSFFSFHPRGPMKLNSLLSMCYKNITFFLIYSRFSNGNINMLKEKGKLQKTPYKRLYCKYILVLLTFHFYIWTGMCVLAGCDFLPSISGIGTKRAYSIISKYKDINRVWMITPLILCYY